MHGATELFRTAIDNEFFYWWDGGWNTNAACVDNTWYHVRVDFECTAGVYKGLAQFDWHMYINGVHYGDYNFAHNEAHADEILFWSNGAESGAHLYLDALGFSWDPEYIALGDNVYWDYYDGRASRNFEDDDLWDTNVSPVGWAITDPAGVDSVTFITEFDEHKKFVQLFDSTAQAAAPSITDTFADGAQVSGTVEFWHKRTGATENIYMLSLIHI